MLLLAIFILAVEAQTATTHDPGPTAGFWIVVGVASAAALVVVVMGVVWCCCPERIHVPAGEATTTTTTTTAPLMTRFNDPYKRVVGRIQHV